MTFICFLLLFTNFAVELSNGYFLNEEECLNYTIYPVQYELTIIPYVYKDRGTYYDCEIRITVIANAPNVQIIELDAKDIEIQKNIKVLHEERDLVNQYRPYEYNNKAEKLIIYLREPLQPYTVDKTQYNIVISFRKTVDSASKGVFVVPYEDGGTKYLISTRLSPDKAKYFFPCFDNPRFEAVFKFRVYVVPNRVGSQQNNTCLVIAKEQRRHDLCRVCSEEKRHCYDSFGLDVLSKQLYCSVTVQQRHKKMINVIKSDIMVRDNYVIVDYIPSPQVALHHVGFHYSQFASNQVSAKKTNDTLVIWAPRNKLQYYNYILRFGETIVNLIHDYASVNRPLVYGPINIVAIPIYLEGYEIGSWNLLTNGEHRLAHVPYFTSIRQEERMTFELAQQLCRIWLGNPGELQRTRWNEEWFKEGLATYLAYYLLSQYQHDSVPTTRHRWPIDIYGLQIKFRAMSEDWYHSTPALTSFNKKLAVEIPPRYKELVNLKTASLLWMVENWLGSEKFHTALVKYINTRRGQYVSLEDFMTHLDIETVECVDQSFNGSTASRILNSWFHQPGYPVISVNVFRDRTPNVIQLKQSKFSFTPESRSDSRYLIPISYVVQNSDNCFNCYQPRFTIDQTYTFEENLNGGWIILNKNASGYYRVNYDKSTWKLIAKTLKENKSSIDENNRAQIVNDIFALYTAGDIDQALAVEVLDYLDDEYSPRVWDAAISGFELMKMDGSGCNMTHYLYKDWQEFMRAKAANLYKKLVDNFDKEISFRLFRSNILTFACEIGYGPCTNKMRYMYERYMRGSQKLDPDTREACFKIQYQTDSSFRGQAFNTFEYEDKVIAEHKVRKERQFLYKIPIGIKKLERMVMNTTTPAATSIVSEMQQHQDYTENNVAEVSTSSCNFGSKLIIIVAAAVSVLSVV